MRPGQNKRMRGRNNNNNGGGNRRGPNPLTRSYESNGPDVKIRGTAQHIGEKYLQLARDAQTSGDPVAAENYLQHAEHYFRIIAAAQQAQQQAQFGYQRQPGEAEADESDGDEDLVMPDRFALPSERVTPPTGTGQQPPYPAQNGGYERQDRTAPANEGYRAERQDRGEFRQDREQRQDRDQRQDREQRQDRDQRQDYRNENRQGGERQPSDRQGGERGNDYRDRSYRNDRNQQRGQRYPREGGDYRDQRADREQPREYRDPRDGGLPDTRPRNEPVAAQPEDGPDLPAFITAPVRAPSAPVIAERQPDAEPALAMVAGDAPSEAGESVLADGDSFPVKPRRRRRARAAIEGDAAAGTAPEADQSSE